MNTLKGHLLCRRTLGTLLAIGCLISTVRAAEDPLPSWNAGPTKQSIIDFVKAVTTEGTSSYVRPGDRIAVFDNDGTLWAEQPMYVQLRFALDRVKTMAPSRPEWRRQQPFKKLLETPSEQNVALTEHEILELVMATHADMTTDEFERVVLEWLAQSRDPRFNRPYTELVYQPMLELLAYLRANGFKTWIVSGGGISFMRPWAEKVYGVPPEQIVGSSIKTKFEIRNGDPVLVRLPELDFIDDKEGKPVGIHQHIGRRPIAAFGNSDGDLQMLQWTAGGPGSRLMVIVQHTDAEREWAYDRESPIGRLDKALKEARERKWTVVDMKKDWRTVFPAATTP